VDEKDAAYVLNIGLARLWYYLKTLEYSHAQDLIKEYWAGVKGRGISSKKTSQGRPSTANSQSASAVSAPPSKKRGRKSMDDDSDIEMVPAEQEPQKQKKSKKGETSSQPPSKKEKVREDAAEAEVDEEVGNMDEWMDAKSWEHLIDKVDTVERTEDGKLWAYFKLSVFFSIFLGWLSSVFFLSELKFMEEGGSERIRKYAMLSSLKRLVSYLRIDLKQFQCSNCYICLDDQILRIKSSLEGWP
jgi:hypothetical protein